jgi:PAS domain S-box-containing protein
MHTLLKRQLKKYFGQMENLPKDLGDFADAVNDAYNSFDADRAIIERSVDISSEELMRSVSLMSATIEATDDGILVVDREQKVLTYNQKFISIWEIPDDVAAFKDDKKLLDCVLDKLTDPEDFIAKVKYLYENPEELSLDIINFKDGRIVERFSAPQKIGSIISGRVWSFRDVTVKKQTELALKQSEQMLQHVMDNIPQAIFWRDRNSTYLGCNRSFAKHAGLAWPEDIIGKTDYDLPWKKEESDFYRQCDAEIMQSDTPRYHIIETQRQADGKEAWIDTNKVPLHDANNNVIGIIGTYEDITERRQAEEEIENSRANLIKMIDAMPFGVVVIDKNRTIRMVNGKVVEMTGRSDRSELVGKICHKFICPADQNNCPVLDKHQRVDQSERVILAKDGRQIPILKSVIPMILDNEEVLLEAFIDISTLKQAEEEMKNLNKKLEDANQEMKNFLSVASHDLREPLRKIGAFAFLLEKSLSGKISPDDSENLQFMMDGSGKMTKMIESLLAYSTVIAKDLPLGTVKLDDLVDRLKNTELAEQIGTSGAIIDIPKPLPPVEAYTLFMRQLLHNLISNGIKYQRSGNIPHITITSKPAANGMVKIEITDNGIGIAPEYHQAIFTMFKRLHLRSEYDGIGIGLTISKKIVERHGGQIGVESEPSKGSTFWFTVPAAAISVVATPLAVI